MSPSNQACLHLLSGRSQICVNDDLVAKKFAVYASQLAAGRELDEQEQEPVMLPPSVLKQSAVASARAPPPGKRAQRASGPSPAGPGLSLC